MNVNVMVDDLIVRSRMGGKNRVRESELEFGGREGRLY